MSNSVSFSLPALPGSVNEIYEINDRSSGLPRKRLKAEWALWVSRMLPYVPRFEVAVNSIVRVDRCYYYQWFYANGNWRRCDAANMDKLLFDLIERKTGINDLYFKQGMLDSRDSKSGKVAIVLTEITEEQWRQL